METRVYYLIPKEIHLNPTQIDTPELRDILNILEIAWHHISVNKKNYIIIGNPIDRYTNHKIPNIININCRVRAYSEFDTKHIYQIFGIAVRDVIQNTGHCIEPERYGKHSLHQLAFMKFYDKIPTYVSIIARLFKIPIHRMNTPNRGNVYYTVGS